MAEELLARHQRNFASYEMFLSMDATTPPQSPQLREQQQHRRDPNETVLEADVEEDRSRGRDGGDSGGESVDGRDATRRARRPHAYQREGQASPAARAPHTTTTAALARAIAAHGGHASAAAEATPAQSGSHCGSAPRSLPHPHTTAPASAAAPRGRRTPGELDSVDQLISERLRAAGRYWSPALPDAMYTKSQAWAQRRSQVTAALRLEKEDAELQECTFRPALAPTVAESGGADVADGARGSSGDSHTNDGGGRGTAVVNDPGVLQHVSRLEEARQRRRDAEARLSGANARRWTGRPTVPHAFELGLRVAEPIASLRQPCAPPHGERAGDVAAAAGSRIAASLEREAREERRAVASAARRASHTPIHAATVTNTAASQHRSAAGSRRGTRTTKVMLEATTATQSATREELPPQQQQQQQQQQEQHGSALTASVTAIAEDGAVPAEESSRRGFVDVGAQDLVQRLTSQLAHKDTLIHNQSADLQRLHRELEAVKETLQQIASLGVSN